MKLIFLTKENEICSHDYSSKNMLNDIFPFSVSVYWARASANRFFWRDIFLTLFIRKMLLILFLSNIKLFNRKTVNADQFSIVKIRMPINFMHFQSKLTSEIYQKVENLWKIKAKPCQSANFAIFFSKNSVSIERQ